MNSILDIPTYTPMPQAEREALLADVEAYCREVRPLEDLCYLEHRYNEAVVSLARTHDILGMTVPKQYGGRGADAATYAAAIVRIGREGTSVRTLFSGHCSIGQTPIVEWGTEEQKRRYLPATVTGECILAFGLTEPDAGSNPLEMQSTYRREGDHYVLNGVKYLISNATIAGAIIMFAYPEDPGAGKRRISAFIMDTDGDGIEREALIAKLGMPTSDTGMFELTEYRVPVENLLGAEGDGFAVAMQTLRSGRLSVAAGCVGVIEDCLDAAVDYAKERRQHGKAIARHQLVQDHIARIEVARQTSASIVGDAARWKAASDDRPRCRAGHPGRPAHRGSQVRGQQRRLRRSRPGAAGVGRARLVRPVPARPPPQGRARVPHLRRHRRGPQAQDRRRRPRPRVRCVPLASQARNMERPVGMPARDGLRWRHGQHRNPAIRALRGSPTTTRPAAGVSGLQTRSPAAHRDRPLRGAARVLGCGHRDRLDLRAHHSLSRAAVAPGDALGRADRRSARLADRIVRLDGPAAARRRRRAAAHHAGRRVGVPASGAGQARARGHGGGRGRLSRRGAGGGSHHRRTPRQARAVRIVGIPGSVGGGAGRAVTEPSAPAPPGADDSCAGAWPVPGCGREPGVSRLAGRRDSPGAERAGAVGADERGSGVRGSPSGWQRRSARAKAPARTTTRCCARNGARSSSAALRKVGWKVVWKPVHGWSARFCGLGGLQCRRGSPPLRRRSPRRPRRRCWRRRSAARMRPISLPRSADHAATAADLARHIA